MWGEDYHWHFDYVRLAWDTGFSFEKNKPSNYDKSKICLVDIEQIIKDRDIAAVERNISTVVKYVLENDQAEVLDTNFVKMFRMCQLAVEYLLFCKKYLDNTTVLLKKELAAVKEENRELKDFTADLESHVTILTQKLSEFSKSEKHKCIKCSKMFTSESYLNAHIKRRHTVFDDNSSTQSEADKLQSEIKQLKERLNNTEKLILDNNAIKDNNVVKEKEKNDSLKVSEIQENFERFKSQVENELKILQMQKAFYEEKYGKLIDVVSDSIIRKQNEKEIGDVIKNVDDNCDKIDHTTQTDKKKKHLTMEVVHDKNVFDFTTPQSSPIKNNDVVTKESISNIEETIEKTVCLGLEKIESQMNSFLNKLCEFEESRSKIPEKNYPTEIEIEKVSPILPKKPMIKPRSKFTITNRMAEYVPEIKSEDMKKANEAVKVKQESYSSSESEESSLVEVPEKKLLVKPSVSTLGQHSITSLIRAADDKDVLEELKVEVQNVVNSRLQDIGVSPDWKTIPQKSYEKALEIIKHQALLTKKSYPEFPSIRDSIENDLNKSGKSSKSKTKGSTLKLPSSQTTTRRNAKEQIMKFSLRRRDSSNNIKTVKSTPLVTIKNRSLYATDSDSGDEVLAKPSKTTAELHSKVITELKNVLPKSKNLENIANSDEVLDVTQTKGVLKNYPSVGSLAKKKVLFDIQSESINEKETAKNGSTDSIASSVFDALEPKTEDRKKVIEVDSDFDISDL